MTLDGKNENKKSFTNFLKKVLTKQIRCDRIYERKRDWTVTARFSPSGKLCLSKNLILGNCVTAARQTLHTAEGGILPGEEIDQGGRRDRTVTAKFSPSGKLCLSKNLILGNCVTAARQTLTLFVGVRIPIPQPERSTAKAVLFFVLAGE